MALLNTIAFVGKDNANLALLGKSAKVVMSDQTVEIHWRSQSAVALKRHDFWNGLQIRFQCPHGRIGSFKGISFGEVNQ